MSIEDRIRELTQAERIRHLGASLASENVKRNVFVTNDLYERMRRSIDEDTDEAFRMTQMIGIIQNFIAGKSVTFGMDPHAKSATCIMAKASPVEMGVVDFRCMDPRPGSRLFGGFALPDVFLGLRFFLREEVPLDFEHAVVETRRQWNALVGGEYIPINGLKATEMVTENVLPV